MEIVRLPVGKQAPMDADSIRIEQQREATYTLTASALCIESEGGASVSIVGGPIFATLEQAETAGIAWANEVEVDHLFVSRSTLEQPFETLEMDRP